MHGARIRGRHMTTKRFQVDVRGANGGRTLLPRCHTVLPLRAGTAGRISNEDGHSKGSSAVLTPVTRRLYDEE